ncbi:MAG: hypothetical protein LBJ63_00025 [Prevotellaceae bacterium]|jgi:hypothetical protein|nr:hypothetical protein [Prevotellaceae bacterium]
MEKVLIVFIMLLSLAALGLIIALIFLWWVDRKISKSPRRHGRKPDSADYCVKEDNYDYPDYWHEFERF